MQKSIINALSKVKDFLMQTQGEDGAWNVGGVIHNEPSVFVSESVLTAQAVLTLNMIGGLDTVKCIRRGLRFCYENGGLNDPIEILSFRSIALSLSDKSYLRSEATRLASKLSSLQVGGYWRVFPYTFNATNYCAVSSLYFVDRKKFRPHLNKSKIWFMKSMAKDRFGWDAGGKSENSQVSFTSNVVVSLIKCGVDPMNKKLENVRTFLEESQNKDGGWGASQYTVTGSNNYSTAFTTLALMLLSSEDSPHVRRGIKYLLDNMSSKGWSWKKREKPRYNITYYATKALSFYLYLHDRKTDLKECDIYEGFDDPRLNAFLYHDFKTWEKQRFRDLNLAVLTDLKALGSTSRAIRRRKDILQILSKKGDLDPAQVIDELKQKDDYYSFLSKKYHITQIKNDLEHLKDIGLVERKRTKYFVV